MSKDETRAETGAAWFPSPVELNENERRVAWYAISCRIEKKEKAPKSSLPSRRRADLALFMIEKRFYQSLSASQQAGIYDSDPRGDAVVAAVESLRELRHRIDKSSARGLYGFALAYVAGFADAALGRFMQAAPADCHEHLKLEVVDGIVVEAG